MRIAIIEAGEPPGVLVPRFGTYGAMIGRLLGEAHETETFRAFDGQLPDLGFDAYVVSGSACGVYDNLPWIVTLGDFVRAVAAERRKLVGICFGHRLMAQAFGGTVTKAPQQGWGIGLQRYDIVAPAPWMDGAQTINVTASHGDQVITPPPRCTVHAGSAFTPYAMLSYADHPSLSVQFHPEFTPDFARALLCERPAAALTEERVAAALASFDRPNDNRRLADWIGRFLEPRTSD